MAVEATHLNLFSQQLIPNRDFVYSNQGNGLGYNSNTHMGSGSDFPVATAMPEVFLPLHQSILCDSLQPKTSINTESELTYNVSATRKRSRDSFDQFNNNTNIAALLKNNANEVSQFPSFLGERLLPQIQQYQFDVDNIIGHHSKKIRVGLEERQKQHARLLVAAIGESLMKKLKEKDEQIQRMGKLNLALQERVKSLYVENQLWRNLAQTNEATANSLRTNLEQILAHVSDERLSASGFAGAAPRVEDEAESCCGSNDHLQLDIKEEANQETSSELRTLMGTEQGGMRKLASEAQENKGNIGNNNNWICRICGERESCVLLLPCRHLCLCTVCGSHPHQNCPVCKGTMNATLHVNLSS